jgi:hypothetical protein
VPQSLKSWLVIAVLFIVGLNFLHNRSVQKRLSNSAPVTEVPAQSAAILAPLQIDGFDIEPVARYEIRAKVLSVERYRMGREADLSPVDFALGWGPMSDNAIVNQLSFSQSNRWYFYRWSGEAPADANALANASANTHIVPIDKAVKKRLLNVKAGEVVKLKGHLINVKHSDGWAWRSSLSREDRGNGSCELMLVEDFSIE